MASIDERNRYNEAVNKYSELLDKYTGDTGFKNLTNMVAGQTEKLTNSVASSAANQAQTQARNAGMSKAMSAMLAAQQGSQAAQNAYGNLYGNILGVGQQSYRDAISGTANQRDTAAEQRDKAIDRIKGQISDVGSIVGKVAGAAAKSFDLLFH